MTSLSFEPLIPIALWLLLATGGTAVFVSYALKRPAAVTRQRWRTILALFATGLAGVMTILLNPTWVEPVHPVGGKPMLTLVVDATGSMGTVDAPGGRTRFAVAADLVHECAQQLGDRFDIRVESFGGDVSVTDVNGLKGLTPGGNSTDLAAALLTGVEADRLPGAKPSFS